MSSPKPYIGCRIGLISKAQNRYEGILYTIDKVNSTVVLAKVRCFGTERRPTDRPNPPKDDIYEFITFRGSDIKDIALCEPPRTFHGLPPDPAIVQSSGTCPLSIYSTLGPFSPSPAFNQLAASSLFNQQHATVLGQGSVIPGLYVRRGPMVEKAVQTQHVDRFPQNRALPAPKGLMQRWERRQPPTIQREPFQPRGEPFQPRGEPFQPRGEPFQPRGEPFQPRGGRLQSRGSIRTNMRSGSRVINAQRGMQQNNENMPPRNQGPQRHRSRSTGQLMVAKVLPAVLKFDTDFDFDSSNAQFIKEELERRGRDRVDIKERNYKISENQKDDAHLNAEDEPTGTKFYYDRAKSFFDNISSDYKFRLTWAQERKRNLETFGTPGRFLRGQGFRGGQSDTRQSGLGFANSLPFHRPRNGPQ